MLSSILLLLPVAFALPASLIEKRQGAGDYGQCGGEGWSIGCSDGWNCVYQNPYYSQCLPNGVGFTKRDTVGEYGQCGGDNWSMGCIDGWNCVFQNPWYSQCLPNGGGFTKRKEESAKSAESPKTLAAVKRQDGPGLYGQCAGEGWSTGCVDGSTCQFQNEWYSQCL